MLFLRLDRHVDAERDAGEGDHKQEKPNGGQNEAYLSILLDAVARFTCTGDSRTACTLAKIWVIHERPLPDAIARR
jgi:hypothetical protein